MTTNDRVNRFAAILNMLFMFFLLFDFTPFISSPQHLYLPLITDETNGK